LFETCMKLSMGLLLVASVPSAPHPEVWCQWGLAGLVVGYTLWRDTQREKRMAEALEKHQEWVRTTLVGTLARTAAALEKVGISVGPLEPK